MPRKNFENFGDLQQYEYIPGVISLIDGEADTCSVTIGEGSYSDVPIYYHCVPDSPLRDNGAIEGAAAGFTASDEVVVLRQRGVDEPALFVVAHMGEKRHCAAAFVIVVSTQSGDEAFAWDLATDSLLIGIDTLSNVEAELQSLGGFTTIEALPGDSVNESWLVWTSVPPTSQWALLGYEAGDIADSRSYGGAINQPKYLYDVALSTDVYTRSVHFTDTSWQLSSPWSQVYEWIHNYITYPGDMDVDDIDNPLMPTWDVDHANKGAYGLQVRTEYVNWADVPEYVQNKILEYLSEPEASSLSSIPVLKYYYHSVFNRELRDKDSVYYASQAVCDAGTITVADMWTDGLICEDLGGLDIWPQGFLTQGMAQNAGGKIVFDWFKIGFYPSYDAFDANDLDQIVWVSQDTGEAMEVLRLHAFQESMVSGKAKDLYDLVNLQRTSRGIQRLELNLSLCRAAEAHLADEIANNFQSHTGSDGSLPTDRAVTAEYDLWHTYSMGSLVGENLARNDYPNPVETAVLDSWYNSTEGHWELLLDEGHNETGVAAGYNDTDGQYYFVQVFGIRYGRWPGYAEYNPESLKAYMDTNFTYTNNEDKTRKPRIFLA